MVDEVHSMNLVFLANFGAKYENLERGKQILNLSAVERPLKKCGLCVVPVNKKISYRDKRPNGQFQSSFSYNHDEYTGFFKDRPHWCDNIIIWRPSWLVKTVES